MNTRGQLARCGPAHPTLEAERQAGDTQSQKARGNLSPRDSILYQTAIRLPVANQDFLGFLTVDICREGCSQRSAPQKRHTAHLSRHPENQAAGTGEAISHSLQLRVTALTKHLVTRAAQTCDGHKMQAQPSLHLCGVPKNLNLSSLELGTACNPGPASDSSPAEQPRA